MKHKIIVVGGGASGIIAAIAAKDSGADVAILEGNDRIGKKILITGNGRCNISNENIEASRYHGENTDFPLDVLSSFDKASTVDFFNSIGLPLITLEDGKMFPLSLQASSVLDLLRFAIADRDIPVYFNSKVKVIHRSKSDFKIYTQNDEQFECEKLILCTGGKSAPSTGSDGLGFNIAKALGHSIITPIPALVQLKLDYKHLKALSGVKFDGCAEIYVDNAKVRREFGEILFTDYGISGPPILQLSRIASYNLSRKKNVKLKLDIIHNMSEDELVSFLETHFAIFGHRSLSDAFIGIINKKMIPILLKEAGITDIHVPCFNLEWKQKQKLISLLKDWTFEVCDTNSFVNSQVTAGGINTRELNDKTLESKLVPGLYVAGEILDVDADCGGFNLQWAWSSGYIAGSNAASRI